MTVGFALDPLVHLGYLSPLAGSIIGVSLPLGIEEVQTGKVSVADIEAVASKVISLLETSGKLTKKEQLVADVSGQVLASLQNKQAPQASTK